MIEGLVMAVQDKFLANGKRPFPHANFYQSYGGSGCRTQHRLCLFVKIRAEIHICFSAGEFHRKCQAGGITAFLAVLFRQKFVDIKCLECHVYFTSENTAPLLMAVNVFLSMATVFG